MFGLIFVRKTKPYFFFGKEKKIAFGTKFELFKRLHLVKTTSWQHRFLDLTNLAPMWLRTYEYMKNTLQNFFFQFQTGLPDWIFQIWPKLLKSDPVLVYMKKSLFWAFFGPPKVSRPLGIPKEGARSVKVQKIGIQHV